MSSKAPNYCSNSHRGLPLLLLLICTVATGINHAQMNLKEWTKAFDDRCALEDFKTFERDVNLHNDGLPGIKEAVPELDPLERALQPWGEDRSRENECMQVLMGNHGKRLIQLNALYGLFGGVIDEAWTLTTLPPSFRWIPALTTVWNQSAHTPTSRSGLWWNDPTGFTNETKAVDERGIPAESTAAAIAQLEKFQRRFPNDPHRVLVAYVKGMPFATRWSGQTGFDKELDEWLALYKVVSRLMVNTDLPDQQVNWINALRAWNRVTCEGERTRTELTDKYGIPAGVLTQFLPWWNGEILPCEFLDTYEVKLPATYSSRWDIGAHPTQPQTSANTPCAQPIAEPDRTSYSATYTCVLHEVKAGETLWNISKRYPGTTPEWIAEINEITDYIRIGEVLCIPTQP